MCEIVQTIDYIDKNKIEKVIREHEQSITEYAFICHDKDLNEKGEYKTPHWHIMLHLNADWQYSGIAKWFDCGENFVGKIKSPRFNSALAYLTHSNAIDKYQYDVAEIYTNIENIERKIKGEMLVKERNAKISANDKRQNEIMEQIQNGEIMLYNIHEKLTVIEYHKYQRAIKNAFEFRASKLKSEVNRKLEAVYIHGDSGTGKTTIAKKICDDRKLSVFISSGSNDVLDGYRGEQAIILDDLRPSCMGLSDLLKMLDNHTASSVKSRYQNKVLECRLIIITTTLDIEKFFHNVFMEQTETAIQLQRRCQVKIELTQQHMIYADFNNETMKYDEYPKMINPITQVAQIQQMNEEDKIKRASEMLKSMGLATEYIAENLADIIKNKELGQQKEKKK